MTGGGDFREIILRQGLEAAMAERDRRKEALVRKRQELSDQLREVKKQIARRDNEFRQAYQEAGAKAGIIGSAEQERAYRVLPYKECVLAILRDHGNEMKSRDLYRLAEGHGRLRQTLWVAVSHLIRDQILARDDLPGERGSLLRLR